MKTQKPYYITTEKISVGYDGKPLIEDVEIALSKGEILTLLGPNGAGKSTMVRILGGAESPTKGDVSRTSRGAWPIGFSGCFHGSLTGRENLRFVSRIYGADIRTVPDYVEDISELGDYMDMQVKT